MANSRAFTLLETLVVIVILSIVVTLSVVSYSSVVQAAALTQSADMISNAFSEGRQDAITQNTTVEVRIYKVAPSSGTTTIYRALQLHWLKSDGSTPGVASTIYLPASVAIDATASHSPLIASNTQTATPDSNDHNLNSDTRVFHFLPDGTTDLNSTTNWFLTVRAAALSNPSYFPSNWASVRVDPTTGRAQIYRP